MCYGNIESIQVKEFENLLEDYHVKDCISHAEEIRIIKDELSQALHKKTYIKVVIPAVLKRESRIHKELDAR